jgi:hypothetical protein
MSKISSEIDVYMDYVVAFGQRIERPSRMARSQWIKYWEIRSKL